MRSALERARGAARRAALAAMLAALGATAIGAAAQEAALRECRITGIEHAVQCGSVHRPIDATRPNGPAVDVQFVVVPAMARRKLPDPVFFLAGGPGQSAIGVAPLVLPLLERLRNRRDIVFVDQRGTGRSAPLSCSDAREPFSEAADSERQIERIAACRRALGASGNGKELMRHATTTEAMQDLDAVRLALGVERIDLIGGSYGTRAALEYQRQFPQAVRRMVLDGVAPPDMTLVASLSADSQAALDALFESCARAPACARLHPALRDRWEALLAGLPRQIVVDDPLTGERTALRLTRDAVLGAVRGPLYAPALAAALPAAIDAAAEGRFEGLMGLASMLASRRETDLALGMHFSVVCAEDVPRLPQTIERPGADFGEDFARFYARVCADWPRGQVPAEFYRLGRSAAPVLLLSGGADPATPPRHATRVAAALGPLARQVVLPQAGHGVLPIGCMRDVVFRFVDAPEDRSALEVDASCAANVPRPPAYEPPTRAASAP